MGKEKYYITVDIQRGEKSLSVISFNRFEAYFKVSIWTPRENLLGFL